MAPDQLDIPFGDGKTCVLKLNAGSAAPGRDPELTLSRYPIAGLERGELAIVVTRTSLPAIVDVKASEHDTGLNGAEIEQIRKTAESIFRGKVG